MKQNTCAAEVAKVDLLPSVLEWCS